MVIAGGVRVFISYARVDDALRERLRAHLSPLEREGLVQAWDDREILGGDDWADEIDQRLDQADVILLLVTADLIKSDYCYGKELERALQRNVCPTDRAIVIPIILRPCDWESTRFARLQALPPGARPLPEWETEEHYYTAVAKGLRRRIEQMIASDSRWIGRVGRQFRDPLWWQRPLVWSIALLALLAGISATWGWWQAAARADNDVAQALQALRSGRYEDAVVRLEPACRRFVSRRSCFELDKARLIALLKRPEALPHEDFGQKIHALKSEWPDDPDLLLFSAELTLREAGEDRHPQALADIVRAIELSEGNYPEAYFYLAHLNLLARRPEAALPLLDRALDPRYVPVAPDHYLNMRAHVRAQVNDIDGAVRDYEQSAERGSILSRIELAELLWARSEFQRAVDQLSAANLTLAAGDGALSGRNALPWAFEIGEDHPPLMLAHALEKRCYAHRMLLTGLALACRPQSDAAPAAQDCGPEATRIASAVKASLARAVKRGMNQPGSCELSSLPL